VFLWVVLTVEGVDAVFLFVGAAYGTDVVKQQIFLEIFL
jgi:hypothetical protein